MFHFVDRLIEVTKLVESPTAFLEWIAYTVIGATFRHNVYYSFPSRRTKVVPNMYTLLVADSGECRKSTPLKIANFLIKRTGNTKLIEGRASIQGILKELAEVKRVDKRIIKGAAAVLYSEELAGFLVRDPAAGGILTDIFDYKATHNQILKGEGTLELTDVAPTLLSATNAGHIQDMFTKTDLIGGIVGRIFFIWESKARLKNLGLNDPVTENDWEPLVDHLKKLARFEGRVHLEAEGEKFLDNWYQSTNFSLHDSKTGYEHRAHTNALKLALILAACEENFAMNVRKEHCEKAVDLVISLKKNYHKVVATVGSPNNDTRQAIKDIARLLYDHIGEFLSREFMLRALFGSIDSETLDKALITLEQTGLITMSINGVAPQYKLSPKGEETILGNMKPKGEVQ